jgi:hypothetical protein
VVLMFVLEGSAGLLAEGKSSMLRIDLNAAVCTMLRSLLVV